VKFYRNGHNSQVLTPTWPMMRGFGVDPATVEHPTSGPGGGFTPDWNSDAVLPDPENQYTLEEMIGTIHQQTEIMGAMNKGGHEGLVQSGVVKEKVWISTRDNLTRDSHRKMDGEHVPLKQKYSNGLMYPGDWTGRAEEIINCRCTDTAYSFN